MRGALGRQDLTELGGKGRIGQVDGVQEIGGDVVVLPTAVLADAEPADRVRGSDRSQHGQCSSDVSLGLGGRFGHDQVGHVKKGAPLLAASPGLGRSTFGDPTSGPRAHETRCSTSSNRAPAT